MSSHLPVVCLCALAATSVTASATTMEISCGWVESGMQTGDMQSLKGTGLVLEDYRNGLSHGGNSPLPAPIKTLEHFAGVRVTHCATGTMVAIPARNANVDETDRIRDMLSATEFLRPGVKAGKAVSARDLERAARALFDDVVVFRDNEETCGCNTFYPELRPDGMSAWAKRSDVTN